MLFTAFALAAALAAPPAPATPAPHTGGEVRIPQPVTPPMDLYGRVGRNPDDSARCRAIVQQTLFAHGIRANGAPLPLSRGTWQPAFYPEAGLYVAVNKQVAGCTVPVPMGMHGLFMKDPKTGKLIRVAPAPAPQK